MGRIRKVVVAVAVVSATLAVPLLGRADAGQLSNEAQCRATYLSQATHLPPGSPVSISNGVITIDTNWLTAATPVVLGDGIAVVLYVSCVLAYNASCLPPLPSYNGATLPGPIPDVTNDGGVISVHYGPTVMYWLEWVQFVASYAQCVATP